VHTFGKVQAVLREVAGTLGFIPRDHRITVTIAWIVVNEFM
jgi:hypothetical protein